MTVLIWILLAYVFIKCIGWVLAPFQSRKPQCIEEHHHHNADIYVQIEDSFNADYSSFKGGTYYGAKETRTDETYHTDDYFKSTFGR